MSTEKKQGNSVDSNISLDNIYKAIGHLKPEQQGVILANYKLTELYSIFSDDENYKKYIDDLYCVANGYIDRGVALSALHTEAFLQRIKTVCQKRIRNSFVEVCFKRKIFSRTLIRI